MSQEAPMPRLRRDFARRPIRQWEAGNLLAIRRWQDLSTGEKRERRGAWKRYRLGWGYSLWACRRWTNWPDSGCRGELRPFGPSTTPGNVLYCEAHMPVAL